MVTIYLVTVYFIVVQKKVIGLTPIKPKWRNPEKIYGFKGRVILI